MSILLDERRAWLKAVVHAARIAEVAGFDEVDFSGCRPPATPLEALLVRGLEAEHASRRQERTHRVADPAAARLSEVVDTIATDPDCSPRRIAAALSMSTASAHRLCRRLTGETLMRRVHRSRVNRALRLMLETTISVKEVAAAVGYPRTSALDRQFHHILGCRPSDARKTSNGA
jgi:AraC-like DNA-binding protein